MLWALEQALKSGHLGAVLAWLPARLPADALRRLQLAAQAHDGPAFLLRDVQERQRPSAAPLRLLLAPAGPDELRVRCSSAAARRWPQPLTAGAAAGAVTAAWRVRCAAQAVPRAAATGAGPAAAPRPLSANLTGSLHMTTPRTASGSFDVALLPQATPAAATTPGATLGRLRLDKHYHGDLQAAAQGQMLSAAHGHAGLGRLRGHRTRHRHAARAQRQLRAAAQRVMNRGAQQLEILVVPDSGTGALVGLSGRLASASPKAGTSTCWTTACPADHATGRAPVCTTARNTAPCSGLALHLPLLSLEAFCATLPPAWRSARWPCWSSTTLGVVNAAGRALRPAPGAQARHRAGARADLLLGEAAPGARRGCAAGRGACRAGLHTGRHGAGRADPAAGSAGQPAPVRRPGGLRSAWRPHWRRWATRCRWRLRPRPWVRPAGAVAAGTWPAMLVLGAHATHCRRCARCCRPPRWCCCKPAAHTPRRCKAWACTAWATWRLCRVLGCRGALAPNCSTSGTVPGAGGPTRANWLSLPACFESRIELHTRAESTDQVLHAAAVLLARLVAWAQAPHGRIAACTLHMLHERQRQVLAPPTVLHLALAEPALDAAHLQGLLRERLARTALHAPTLELRLHCADLVPGHAPNGELFPCAAAQAEGLARLLERLRARLGDDQVRCLVPVADHRPECSSRQLPAQARSGVARSSRWSGLGGRLATAPPGLAVARAAAAGRARRAAAAAGPASATAQRPRAHRSRLVGRPGRGARLLHRAGVGWLAGLGVAGPARGAAG
jgi:protein ImuB